MTGKCVLRARRVSPKKAKLVADLIRGKTVAEARAILQFTPKKSARFFLKALNAAVASYNQRAENAGLEPKPEEELVVSLAKVDPGPTWRVLKPAIKPMRFGGYSTMKRRTSHIWVEVSD